jgi:hypothetical protein
VISIIPSSVSAGTAGSPIAAQGMVFWADPFGLLCAGRVSRIASVVRTRRRPTAAA